MEVGYEINAKYCLQIAKLYCQVKGGLLRQMGG